MEVWKLEKHQTQEARQSFTAFVKIQQEASVFQGSKLSRTINLSCQYNRIIPLKKNWVQLASGD